MGANEKYAQKKYAELDKVPSGGNARQTVHLVHCKLMVIHGYSLCDKIIRCCNYKYVKRNIFSLFLLFNKTKRKISHNLIKIKFTDR